MKYIKAYEEVNPDNLKVGDYVICDESNTGASNEIIKFLKSNMGQFIRFREDKDNNDVPAEYMYLVKYEYIPSEIEDDEFDHAYDGHSRLMKRNEIKYWAKDKNDILPRLQVNKFNL